MLYRNNFLKNIMIILTALLIMPTMQAIIVAKSNTKDSFKNTHTNIMYDIIGPPLGSYDLNQNPRKFDYIANDTNKPEIQINGIFSDTYNGIKINSTKTTNTENKINPKYLSQYNELVKATQRHEKSYIFQLSEIKKEYYSSFINEIWSALRSDENVPKSIIFRTVTAEGPLQSGYYRNVKVKFNFDYTVSLEKENHYKQVVKNIVSTFPKNITDDKKVELINKYIVEHAQYAYNEVNAGVNTLANGLDINSPYAILESGKGVCGAYSALFQMMAKESGLESKVVVGTSYSYNNWGSHAWNIVKVNDEWYHVDTTWNDVANNGNYGYLMIGATEIAKNHKWDQNLYPQTSIAGFSNKSYALKNL